jgi:hypothetical protein
MSAPAYLLGRGFLPETIERVGWRVEPLGQDARRYGLPPEAADVLAWRIPYPARPGRPAFERVRVIDDSELARLGGGKYRQPAGVALDLYDPFAWLEAGPRDDLLVIEGEANAVALHQLVPARPAVGLPGKRALKPELAERVAVATVVWLWLDPDEDGYDEALAQACERLWDAGVWEVREVLAAELPRHPETGVVPDAADLLTLEPRREAADRVRALLDRATEVPRPLTQPDGSPRSDHRARRVELTPASAIRSERLRWVWRDRVARRSVAIVAGEKGLGKSTLTNAKLAADLTRGMLEGEFEGRPADVLVASAEDDWRSVIKPRLMAHGADLDRVHRVELRDEAGDSLLTLPDDVVALEAEVERLRAAGREVALLVIDPIGAFLAQSTDTHRDASVRRALAPLAAMADRLDLAVVVVAHLTKDESARLINRVNGAGAFVNAARSVLAFARDPGDPEGEQGRERVLVLLRSNWGRPAPSLAMRVESREVDLDDGSRGEVGYLVVTGETAVGVEDLQRGADEDGSDCEEAVAAALADGPRPSKDVKASVAEELGCARKTVERAAVRMLERGELEIEAGGFPRRTTWTLVGAGDSRDADAPDSGDHGSGAVGTIPNAKRVPTDIGGIPTGVSAPSGDSGDRPPARTRAREPAADRTPRTLVEALGSEDAVVRAVIQQFDATEIESAA